MRLPLGTANAYPRLTSRKFERLEPGWKVFISRTQLSALRKAAEGHRNFLPSKDYLVTSRKSRSIGDFCQMTSLTLPCVELKACARVPPGGLQAGNLKACGDNEPIVPLKI
jgi:hypothetical protein